MLDPWQYALALLTGTLAVQAVAWTPECRRVVHLLDDDEARPLPPRATRRARLPRPHMLTEVRLRTQEDALAVIFDAGSMQVTGLAASLGISKYAARRLMRRLEGAGLVRRAVQGWVAVRT